MRGISTEKVCFIIVKAREIQAKVAAGDTEPGSNPVDDRPGFREVLEDRDDVARAELRAFIDGLNTDEAARLVALLWTGRGDFAPEEWDEAVAEAAEQSRRTADYLLGTPLLADLLQDGLEAFGESCTEFERGRL